MRVAIIGGGPSGIVALKAFLAEPQHISIVKVFERRPTTGGAWNHTPVPLGREVPSHVPSITPAHFERPTYGSRASDGTLTSSLSWLTPMYDKLNTNIPADLMAYKDTPFKLPSDALDFPNRETVLDYLVTYGRDVMQHVELNAEVLSVIKAGDVWKIRWAPTNGPDMVWEEFDRIVIASGHYETVKIPEIVGLAEYHGRFPGRIHHSKYYRSPTIYKDKRVLVVGSGPSGTDIARQISEYAMLPVARSTRSTSILPGTSEDKIRDVSQITQIHLDGSITLLDGSRLDDIDHIVFCTGYLYSFPYLEDSLLEEIMSTNGEYLTDLYEQVLHIRDPTIAFLAMGMSIVPFPIAEAQSCFIARLWTERLPLPSQEDMVDQERQRLHNKGSGRLTMYLGHPDDGFYIDRLRQKCLKAEPAGGMLPVDWLRSDRVWLRANMSSLKHRWLELQRTTR